MQYPTFWLDFHKILDPRSCSIFEESRKKKIQKKCAPNSSDALGTGFFLLTGASGSAPGLLAGRGAAV